MRRLLQLVGGLFLFAVLGIGGFITYAVYQGKALDASSEAYVRANVPAIVSPWSKQALLERASPQLLKQIRKHPGKIDRMFRRLSSLGAMQRIGSVEGESNTSYNLPDSESTTAAYVLKVAFANGSADIKVRLILIEGKWRFLNFYVTAPASLKPQPAETTI